MRAIRELWRAWQGWRGYSALPSKKRRLTFYTEDVASWAFFEPVVRALTEKLGRDVAYLTSAPDDPRLEDPDPHLHAFYVGDGFVRTMAFFQFLGPVVVMTMPDLETYYLKRSQAADVHYAYIFHAMTSTHMVYRTAAFDAFDSLLCVGPHHMVEVRAREARLGLKEKRLFPHGYARLDHILATRPDPLPIKTDPTQVLLAPSWGPHGLLETRGVEATRVLVEAGYRVVVRPHPHTVKTAPECIEAVRKAFAEHELVELELDVASTRSLYESAIMVSDWSGAAIEYGFGLERPVLFVDVPRKVNNPDWESLGLEPLEAVIREDLGRVVAPDALDEMPAAIEALLADAADYPEHLAELRDEVIYNVGTSGEAAARVLAGLVDELK